MYEIVHEFFVYNGVVLDELRKNSVDIDMTMVSYHMHQCLEQYKTMYEEMATRVEAVDLPDIFNDMNVNNFGRANRRSQPSRSAMKGPHPERTS